MKAVKGNLTSFSSSSENRALWMEFNPEKFSSHPEFGTLPYNARYPDYVEVLEKRTREERYFVHKDDRSKFQIQKALGALHYKKDGQWVTIDPRLKNKGNGILEASNQYDPVGFDLHKAESYIVTPQGKITFNNWSLYGQNSSESPVLLANANWSNYTAGDDGVYVIDVFPGIDAEMTVNRGSIKTNFIVKSQSFPTYKTLLFKDNFKSDLNVHLRVKDGGLDVKKAAAGLILSNGKDPLLEIGEAVVYLENEKKDNFMIAEYEIDNSSFAISVNNEWVSHRLTKGRVVIDPLVTSSNSLAQASITGSMYNASCNWTNSCNYNLTVNTPANSTITDVKWSFVYLATGSCYMNDGSVKFLTGTCTSPIPNNQYWYCNSATGGTCTGTDISIFSDLGSCLPGPACSPSAVTFTMRFFRSCWGAAGCSNNCIGSGSPWTMTLEGRTVEWTNTATPFTISNTNPCAGSNITVNSNGVQYGVSPYSINWSYNVGGVPSIGTGNSATFAAPLTTGVNTIYAIVTDNCGITSTASRTINVAAIPVANAGTTKSLTCIQTTTVLNGSGGGTYSWTGPGTITSSTSQNPTVNTAGTFTLVVSNGTCSSLPATVSVIANTTPPSASITGPASVLNCTNTSVNLAANPNSGATYVWSGPSGYSSAAQNINVTLGGTYNLTVTSTANGCTATTNAAVTQNTTAPAASITGPASVLNCTNTSVNLSANPNAGATYNWSGPSGFSSTSQNFNATLAGTYNLTVTSTANGCTATANAAVNQNTTAPAASITVPSTLNCTNTAVQLTGNPTANATYTWSGPSGFTSNSGTPNVTLAGTYSLTVTSTVNGCTATTSAAVNQNTTAPSASITVPASVLNCTNTTVQLTGNPTANATYTWSGPSGFTSNSGTPNVTIGGTYNLTVTSTVNGCTATTNAAVNQNTTAPSASITVPASVLNCTNTTVQLTGNPTANATYTWSGPSGFTSNSGTPNVTIGGTYNLTVTSTVNGCTATTNAAVTQNTTAPSASITVPASVLNCTNTTVQLTGNPTANATYTWSGPSGFTSNSGTPNVTLGGTYNLTVTSTVNGCTATANAAVNQNTTAPAASITVPAVLNCTNTSMQLTGNPAANATYTWSGPSGFTSNSGTPNVTLSGTYNLTVTSTVNGCTATTNAAVNQNTTAPTASITVPAVLNCTNTSMQLTGNPTSNATYTWSGPSGFTSNSGTPNVTMGGTYSLTVTSTANGCTATANASVTQNNTAPTPTINIPAVLNCTNTSMQITGSPSSGVTYTWSGPGGFTSNSGTPNVTLGGTYTLTITEINSGCNNTANASVVQNTTVSATANTSGVVNCTNTAITLNGGPASMNYTWTAPAGSSITGGSQNSQTATATGAGTYSLLVYNATNGCTATAVAAANVNTTVIAANISNSPTITCTNSLVTINGGPAAGVTYSWSGPGIAGASTNANVTVSVTGVYSLNVTNTANGCTSTSPATVNISNNLNTPTLTAAAQTATLGCGSNSVVTLTVTANPSNSGLLWSTSSTNSVINVSGSGTYTVEGTHPGTGCISSLVYTVSPSSGSPSLTVSPATATITCINTTQTSSVTVSNSSNVSYSWTGPGIVGSTTSSVVTGNQGGSYDVTVTDLGNNCVNSISFIITADNTPVTVNGAASIATVNCATPNSTITTAPTPAGTFTYSWSDGSSGSSITVTPTVTTTYSVIVTNTVNGCSGTETYTVDTDLNPPTAVTVSPNTTTLTCANPVQTLTVSATGATGYTWYDAGNNVIGTGTSVAVSSAGVYSVVASGANSCTAAAVSATVDPNSSAPTYTLSSSSPSITCMNSSPSVTVTVTSPAAISGYTWSPASGIAGSTSTNVATFSVSGTYSATIEDVNGCQTTFTLAVNDATASPNPVAGTATAQPLSCANPTITISPTFNPANDLAYSWSGPSVVGSTTSASAQVDQPGSYTLAVTNTLTGCSSTAIVIPVTGNNTVPTLTVASSSSVGISCQPNTATVTLDAQSLSAGLTYSWSNGATTQTISTSTPGVYTVTVTDANLCSKSETISVQNNTITPSVSAAASGNLPCGAGSTSLVAVSTNTDVVYSWTGTGIVSGSNSAVAEVNQAGTYTLVATDMVTGCQATETVAITQSTVSVIAAASATTGPAPLSVNFSDAGSGASTYSWTFGNGSSSIGSSPSSVFSTTGTYTVVLVGTNGACMDSDTLIIKVTAGLGVIPEVFTPNGDGKNDVFYIEGLDSYPKASLQVFNRWGSPVFSENPYKNNWDGSANAAGATGSGKLPSATYFYILELNDEDKTIFKGFVQLQH